MSTVYCTSSPVIQVLERRNDQTYVECVKALTRHTKLRLAAVDVNTSVGLGIVLE